MKRAWMWFVLLALLAVPVVGDTYTWNDSGTDWGTGSSWTPAGPPTATDTAKFNSDAAIAKQPAVNEARAVDALVLDNGGQGWNLTNGVGPLSIGSGGLTINNGHDTAARKTTVSIPVSVTSAQNWSTSGGSTRADQVPSLSLTGSISGGGRISITGTGSLAFEQTVSPAFTGGLAMKSGTTSWRLWNQPAGALFQLGSGPLVFDGGSFLFFCQPASGLGTVQEFELTNPLQVTANGGQCLYKGQRNIAGTPQPIANFSGGIALGGALQITASQTWDPGGLDYRDADSVWSGDITLDQSSAGLLAIYELGDSRGPDVILSGKVQDGAGTYRNPLVLASLMNDLSVIGSDNTHANGTVIEASVQSDSTCGVLYTDPLANLGSGDVRVVPGGILRVSGNVAFGASAIVHMETADGVRSQLQIAYDGVPPLGADACGSLGLRADNTSITDLSTLGGGTMLVGSSTGSETGSGADLNVASLAPGRDGVWHLGGSSGRLHLPQDGVLSGANLLQIGTRQRFGDGHVVLEGANDGFTGDIAVWGAPQDKGGSVSPVVSSLMGYALSTGDSLGSPDGDVALHSGTLRFRNYAKTTPGLWGSKNDVTFEGVSVLSCNDGSSDYETKGQVTFLGVHSVVRQNNGVLVMDGWAKRLPGDGRGDTERIIITNVPSLHNGIVPPYIVAANLQASSALFDFATYDSGSDAQGPIGFKRATYTSTDINAAGASDVVKSPAATLSSSKNVYALQNTGTISGSGVTLGIGGDGYGGLIVGGDIVPDIDFGTNEGVVFLASDSKKLTGKVRGSGGLTIAARPSKGYILEMRNLNNDISGTLAIVGSTLKCQPDTATTTGSLGSVTNIYLDGGEFYREQATSGDRLTADRTITLGPMGGTFSVHYWTQFRVFGKITGPGELRCGASTTASYDGLYVENPANDYSGGTRVLYGRRIVATATGKLGTGDVVVEASSRLFGLQLDGNTNIDPNARLTVNLGGSAGFLSDRPVIGSLAGSGKVNLGTSGAATMLTVGMDNTDASFYGRLYQASASHPGMVVKDGSGTWTLYGAHDYTGETIVSNGTLRLMGSVAGDMTVTDDGTLSGIGQIGGDLTVDGTQEVELSDSFVGLTVLGDADLNGALRISLAPGYDPPKNTTWTVINGAGTVSEDLSSVTDGFSVAVDGDDLILSKPATGSVVIIR